MNRVDELHEDQAGHLYVEIPWSETERVRVTFIPESWSGAGGIRVQVRDQIGHLRQGPEIPVLTLGAVVEARLV
jgi:hypothetical protein